MTVDASTVPLLRGAVPFAALLLGLALERLAPHAALRPEWRVNLGLWLTGVVLTTLLCGGCGFAIAGWAQQWEFGLLNAAGLGGVAAIAGTILVLDLVSYAWHRANHELAFLWRFHRVHHADADFHVSTALRFHPGELVMGLPIRFVAIVALGAPPAGVLVFEAVFAIANVLEHGNFNLAARLERILAIAFVTPALHRRHHSTERGERDANYGTIFCLWDRVARTLQPSHSSVHFATGLRDAVGASARSLPAMLLAPFRSA